MKSNSGSEKYITEIKTCRKGLHVERLHTIPHHLGYNNGFHSCNAALIADVLCRINGIRNSQPSVMYMLLHDVAEGYVGDIPANVKIDNPGLKEHLRGIEEIWEATHLSNMPDLSREEQEICRCSDLIELGMFCIDELEMGNLKVEPVLINVISYLTNFTGVIGIPAFIQDLIRSRP